jgi:hypothetical protein
MVNFQNKKIFYTLKEYQNNYNILLKNYLKQHEDFDELMFLEIEMQFYNMCYDNSNLILIDIGYGPQYSVNGGHCEILIPEIYDAISLNDGFDFELSTKYNSSFYKILLFLIDKKKKADIVSDNLFSIVKNDLLISDEYNENLINDPLHNPENEYQILKSKFKKEYHSKTAHLKTEVDFLLYNLDTDFDEWEKEQKEEINKAFLKLIKELNHKKIFFFGCSFDNYEQNYSKRLSEFLEAYTDASNIDFIEDELKFLENILYDIQNSEGAHDGHSLTGYDIFSKAYEFVSIVGYKQYYFSHNKKVDFLKDTLEFALQIKEFSKPKILVNPKADVEQAKPKTFELSKKLKKQIRFFKISESEQKEFDRLDAEIEENKKNGVIKNTDTENTEFKKEKKPSEKWYALLYFLELKASNTKPPTNFDGELIRKEIEEIGKQRTSTTGQSFYRAFFDLNGKAINNNLLEKSFDKNWKQKVITISNNNELIIKYLNTFI